MTPDEVQLLQHAGDAFLFHIIGIVTRSVLYGLYLAIFALGIRALLKRNPWTTYTRTLFGLLSSLFLISTAYFATTVAALVVQIRNTLIENADKPLIDRLRLANKNVAGLHTAETWMNANGGSGFLFVFADAVVVWRACVLWPGNKIAQAFPSALLLASFGCAVVTATLNTVSVPQEVFVSASSRAGMMMLLNLSLSLFTNVVATILIGYKAYYHRKIMKATMGLQNSRAGPILLFLTESGVAFCIFQVIALATAIVPANANNSLLDYVAGQTWQGITAFAAAAYPVLVLVIVNSHRSIADHTSGGSVVDCQARRFAIADNAEDPTFVLA